MESLLTSNSKFKQLHECVVFVEVYLPENTTNSQKRHLNDLFRAICANEPVFGLCRPRAFNLLNSIGNIKRHKEKLRSICPVIYKLFFCSKLQLPDQFWKLIIDVNNHAIYCQSNDFDTLNETTHMSHSLAYMYLTNIPIIVLIMKKLKKSQKMFRID